MKVVVIDYCDQRGPLAIAHRGGAGLAAENTLDAFRQAHALGLRCFETEVRLTADGHLVAFHDATLQRVTGARGRVRTSTLAELGALQVLGRGSVLPLETLLGSFPDTRFVIDVKDRAAIEPLARLLATSGTTTRICAAGA